MRPWLVPPPPPARHGVVIRMLQAPAVVALAAVLAASTSPATAAAAAADPAPQEEAAAEGGAANTLCNVPPTLSGEDKQAEKIKHPKSASAMRCTSKCVSTCVLGGAGSPGVDGPFNIRRVNEMNTSMLLLISSTNSFCSVHGWIEIYADHWWCSRRIFAAVSTAFWNARTSAT
uniref:Uncharacterized protein n=1 Tax=Oryza glumipatula TaxID=40148 RepID=A0A0D9YM28_9ORYZ